VTDWSHGSPYHPCCESSQSFQADSFKACQQICDNTCGCGCVTYGNNQCYLRADCDFDQCADGGILQSSRRTDTTTSFPVQSTAQPDDDPTPPNDSAPDCFTDTSMTCSGPNLGLLVGQTESSCTEACYDNEECIGISFNAVAGHCYLMQSCSTMSDLDTWRFYEKSPCEENDTTTSNIVQSTAQPDDDPTPPNDSPLDCFTDTSMTCSGTNLGLLVEQTESSCAEACYDNEECIGISFNAVAGHCYLMQSCNTISDLATWRFYEKSFCDNKDCTSGFSNVKLMCGGCRVLTESTSLHPTCNDFCSAQGRSCISAAEEVSNDCEILQTYDCSTDFSALGTSDALCECNATTTSQSTDTPIPTENDPNCPTMGNANGLGFALSTGLMETPISPTRVATIAKNANIKKFRLYGWDSDVEMVSAILSEIPDADFVVEITPTQVNSCATDENVCQEILQRYDEFSGAISYIAVGNEPLHAGRVTRFSNIPDAIANTARVLRALGWRARVTVPFSMSVLRDTYPVSDAFFVEPSDPSAGNACDSGCITSSNNGPMSAILSSIKSQSGVFAIQAYPYFVANTEQSLLQASLDATQVMSNQVAATRVALGKLGFEDLPIIITEVGWPTDGTAVANPENAQAFLSSLADARRNPATSFFDTDVYAFELFDESRKSGASDEQHFGWFSEDGCKKFDISAPSSIPDVPCESNVPDTCSPHLDWAMSSGRFSSVASDYYPDFTFQTGVSLQDATREDMQLYFFCNNVQPSDCTGIAKPCTCSGQPCSCFGSTARLLASDVNSDTGATSDAGQDKNLIIMITIITLLLLVCLIAICYFCGTLKHYCTSKNFQIEDDVDAKSHCELRL